MILLKKFVYLCVKMEFKANIWNIGSAVGSVSGLGKYTDLDIFDKAENLSGFELPRRNKRILMFVVICGTATIKYDMKEVALDSKSLMVLLPGHIIEGYDLSPDFKGYMMAAAISNFSSVMPLLSRLLICSLHFKEKPVIKLNDAELANQILFRDLLRRKTDTSCGIYDSLVVNKLCEGIFYETMNLYFRRFDMSVDTQCRRRDVLFYRFIVEVEQNFISERSVAFYAGQLCVTSKHLSAIIKDISGRTAGDWIDSYVINEIKRLLTTTELTIQEISCRLKFSNQSFLGKYFKNHTGISPREFRKKSMTSSVGHGDGDS